MTTIRQLAKEIQRRWPDLVVQVERGYCNTDRKIGRLRHPGRGRWGTRIKVYDPRMPTKIGVLAPGALLLDHNNAETYRRVSEVQEWMERYAKQRKPTRRLSRRSGPPRRSAGRFPGRS